MLLGVLFLSGCSDDLEMVTEDRREPDADIRIQNFLRWSVHISGRQEWSIKAEEAFLYEENSQYARIVVYDFTFQEFDDAGQWLDTITGQRGEVNYRDQYLQLEGDVTYKGANNRYVEAGQMRYDMQNRIIRSESAVKIIEGDTVTNCTRGAVIEIDANRQICRGPSIAVPSGPGGSGNDSPLDVFD